MDSSIGGKTGVNIGGKNLVGVFWHPTRVVIDVARLGLLPSYLIREGMAEAYKAGLIGNANLAASIEKSGLESDLEEVVTKSISVKADIVDRDVTERGDRAFLNFGHTIGHAIEYASSLSHGESVGLGMVALALNQSWPLIANSPIPVIPSPHQAVGKATVASDAKASDSAPGRARAAGGPRSDASGGQARVGAKDPGEATVDSSPATSTEFVVAPSAPAPSGGHSRGASRQPSPQPAVQQPKSPPTKEAPTPSKPESAPPPVAEAAPPPATISEAPAEEPESHVPPWSNGKGHAYGRSGKDSDDGGDDDD